MNLPENSEPSDSNSRAFENYLRGFRPKATRIDADEILSMAMDSDQDHVSSGSVVLSGGLTERAAKPPLPWSWIGGAWASGVVVGSLLMFIAMKGFNQGDVVSSPTQAAVQTQPNISNSSVAQSNLDRRSDNVDAENKSSNLINGESSPGFALDPLWILDELAARSADVGSTTNTGQPSTASVGLMSSRLLVNLRADSAGQLQKRRGLAANSEKKQQPKAEYQMNIDLSTAPSVTNQFQLTQDLLNTL